MLKIYTTLHPENAPTDELFPNIDSDKNISDGSIKYAKLNTNVTSVIDNKLDKTSYSNVVYGTNDNASQTTYNIDVEGDYIHNYIPIYDSNSELNADCTSGNAKSLVNIEYLNTQIDTIMDVIDSSKPNATTTRYSITSTTGWDLITSITVPSNTICRIITRLGWENYSPYGCVITNTNRVMSGAVVYSDISTVGGQICQFYNHTLPIYSTDTTYYIYGRWNGVDNTYGIINVIFETIK